MSQCWEDDRDFVCKQLIPQNNFLAGPIYSMDFAPSGSVMGAACANKCVLLYDLRASTDSIFTIPNAHGMEVNCIKYLDENLFATCSDDKLVKLWDMRNHSSCLYTIGGHNVPVKELEYSQKDNLLISSDPAGNICGWELSPLPDYSNHYRMMCDPAPLRCRLSPAEDRLVLLFNGFMLIVNNLNIAKLQEDYIKFESHTSRFGGMNSAYSETGNGTRNSMSMIEVCPTDDHEETMRNLTIHPKGWCAISRSMTATKEVWSAVHDLRFDRYQYVQTAPESDDSRLLFYYKEPLHMSSNSGHSFSPDGRLICSLVESLSCAADRYHVRLLAFDEQCSEPQDVVDRLAKPLHVLKDLQLPTHSATLCTLFNPHDPFLFVGCSDGTIHVFYPAL